MTDSECVRIDCASQSSVEKETMLVKGIEGLVGML